MRVCRGHAAAQVSTGVREADMGSYTFVQDGKLYYVEDGKVVVLEEHYRNEIERYGNELLEEVNGRHRPSPILSRRSAYGERGNADDMGIVPTNTGSEWYRGNRPANHVIVRGEAKDSSTSVWLWLLAGAVLVSLLVWWW